MNTAIMQSEICDEQLPWSPSGKLCLELILAEIEKNGKYVYGRENLSQIEFEDFTRSIHNGFVN